MPILSFEELSTRLGSSVPNWTKLLRHLRTRYAMDEFFDGKDELKFRRGGKTLVTLYLREGYFTIMLIFGKAEREAFEAAQDTYPQDIVDIYHASRTYHDGKWMSFAVREDTEVEPFLRLLAIKKKPNRKPEKRDGMILGICGNRCDQCLLHHRNSGDGGNQRFQAGDQRCYHHPDEPVTDYSAVHCQGCRQSCPVSQCAAGKGYSSCMACDYDHCAVQEHNFTEPGNVNIGISNEDIELFVLPYCGRQRFDDLKQRGNSSCSLLTNALDYPQLTSKEG